MLQPCQSHYLSPNDVADLLSVIGAHVKLKRRGASWVGLCPFHRERTGSLTVTPSKSRWKCFGCGAGGSSAASFLALLEGISLNDARRKCGDEAQAMNQTERVWREWDWSQNTVGSARRPVVARRLAQWRGYSLAFCDWLYDQFYIGTFGEGLPCFPIYQGSRIVRIHVRSESGRWFYHPRDCDAPTTAMIIGSGSHAHFFESQWDMFAAMDATFQHNGLTETWIATRGACNANKLPRSFSGYACYIYPQNDGERRSGISRATKGQKWREDILGLLPKAIECVIPAPHKDLNDALQAGVKWEEISGLGCIRSGARTT